MYVLGFVLLLSYCIKPSAVVLPELNPLSTEEKTTHQFEMTELPVDDSRCLQGGLKGISWIDVGVQDRVYTEGVDKNYSETVVCFKNLVSTTPTVTKPGDLKIIATDLAVGDKDCQQGGKRYESFIDVDGIVSS